MKQKSLILFLILLFSGILNAGVTGKIRGKITDKDTGEPLPMVNIQIEGTTLGAASDINGEYIILNITPGVYSVRVSMVGFKTITKTEVEIVQDMTMNLDFQMEETVIQGEEVVVVAKKPMVQKNVTSSVKTVSGDDVERMPVTTFTGFVENTGGAVNTGGADGGLHIRGGRSNEVVYMVDGVNTNDPVTGSRGVTLDNTSIAKITVISGGFNAEYGEAMSGVVNVVTKEGSREDYEGSFQVNTDAPLGGSRYDNGYNRYSFSLGGPLLTRKMTFFVSGALSDIEQAPDRHGIDIKNDDYLNYNGTGKLVIFPSNNFKITLGGNFSWSKEHRYSHARSYGNWLKDGYRYRGGNSQFDVTLNHTINSKTFYEFKFAYFNTYFKYSTQDGSHYQDFQTITKNLAWANWAWENGWYSDKEQSWTRDADSVWIEYYRTQQEGWIYDEATGENSVQDPNYGFYWGDVLKMQKAYNDRYHDTGYWDLNSDNSGLVYKKFDMDNYIEYLERVQNEEDAPEDWSYRGDIDDMYTNYDPTSNMHYDFVPIWHDRSISRYVVKFDITSQINKYNQLKGGVFFQRTDLDQKYIQFLNTNPYFDVVQYKPDQFAGYIQDQIEWEDLTFTPGVRFDYIDLKADKPVNPDNLDEGYEEADPKTQISPRMGMSFAMSDKAKMYANYGHFFQTPEYGDVYQNLNADITSGQPLIGNPDLKPQKTIFYELGFGYQLTPEFAFNLSTYYKNVENLLGTRKVNSFYQNQPVEYTIYRLNDYAKIKGIELGLEKRFDKGFSGSITYSFMQAKGTGSSAREFYYTFKGTESELPRQEYPLEFDVTHSLKLALNYYIPPKDGPEVFGKKMLDDLNINVQYNANSGRPYTPTDRKDNPLEVGSKRLPSTYLMDMRVEKGIAVLKNKRISVYVDVRNLLDAKVIRNVHAYTGKADDDGKAPVKSESRYSQYAYYGYDNWEEYYQEDYRLWKYSCLSTSDGLTYGAPRVIRFGLKFSF